MGAKDNRAEALRAEVKRLRQALNELTPDIKTLLRRRGFKVYKKEPTDDLLIPAPALMDMYYEMLHKYSFRLFLRDVIKHRDGFTEGDVTRFSTSDVTSDYIALLHDMNLIEKKDGSFRVLSKNVKSFGGTLEWFMAEIFKREFASEALWGVKFKRPDVGGDYDLIAKLNGSILYMEVKSSPPKQIYQSEITAFFNRFLDLAAEPAIFFMDTELRMKDKIVPMFEEELSRRYPSLDGAVCRMEKELFQFFDKIFIINAKGSIPSNIEKALSWYFRRRSRS